MRPGSGRGHGNGNDSERWRSGERAWGCERKGVAKGSRRGQGGLIPSMEPRDQRRVCIGGVDVRAASTAPLVNRGRG